MDYIGRYQIVRELGRGAMGVVYLAQHPSMDRMVAIKTFRSPDGEDADWQQRNRLLAEADRAGSLDHPNIVKIYDVDEQSDPAYIVMEYVDGPTLDTLLHTSPPDSDLSVAILRQAAEALDYAHNQGIIHRDIKPANLMLDSRNTLKITDFGIAKRAGTATQTTGVMGTPEYMSPEQLEGRPDIDGRADQFALATIAYLLVTGRKPFEADTVTALSHLIANKNPVPPSQVNRNLGRQVDAVIARALSKNRDRRYGTCTEFTDALEVALMAPPRRAVPRWAPVAAVVVLLAALAAAWALFFPSRQAVMVSVTPDRAMLKASQAQQFRAVVSGGAPDVRWTVTPEVGAISEDGIYRAPDRNPSAQTVTVTATSVADGSVQAAAQVQLVPDELLPPPPSDPGGVLPPPPPPPPPVPKFSVDALARTRVIPRGAALKQDEADLGIGQLRCRIRASGEIRKGTPLRVVWLVDNDELDAKDVSFSGTEVVVPYGNMPMPGTYEIRLMSGKTLAAKTSFKIQPGS